MYGVNCANTLGPRAKFFPKLQKSAPATIDKNYLASPTRVVPFIINPLISHRDLWKKQQPWTPNGVARAKQKPTPQRPAVNTNGLLWAIGKTNKKQS